MATASQGWYTSPLVLYGVPKLSEMSRDEFYEFCRLNENLRIERTADGDLEIMTPAGPESSRRNAELSGQLRDWNKQSGAGIVCESSAGFWLPNGAERSPDVAWIRRERWESLPNAEREKIAPIVPDFVIELRSKSDRLSHLRAKMQEYVDNGVPLGWLIDPFERRVEIYRPGQEPVAFENPTTISGAPELPGFTLDLQPVW